MHAVIFHTAIYNKVVKMTDLNWLSQMHDKWSGIQEIMFLVKGRPFKALRKAL